MEMKASACSIEKMPTIQACPSGKTNQTVSLARRAFLTLLIKLTNPDFTMATLISAPGVI